MSSSETQLIRSDIGVGIYRDTTDYAAQGYYVSCDKIRFRDGKPEKIGGWGQEIVQREDQRPIPGFTGVPRDSHGWSGLDGTKYLAVGTHQKLELMTGGRIYDITPIETSISATNILSTTSGSPLVVVSTPSHGRQIGDFVEVLDQTTSIGNIKLNGVYEIVSVISNNAYQLSVDQTASLTSISGGGLVETNYLLSTGFASNGFAFGWGAGTWGTPGVSVSAGWGNPRGQGTPVQLRQWSLDNYGEDLIANPRGGRIYTWSASTGPLVRATVISAAPSVNNFVLIAQPARNVMSFGCTNFAGVYDPLTVRWSDSENYNNWDESDITSQAGEIRLKGGNYIVGAEQSSKEIIAVTDNASNSITYLANDYIFGTDQIGSDGGLASQHAIVDVNGIVYWMGFTSFFIYDSKVRKLPSTLNKSIFDPDRPTSLNFSQKEKVYGAHNTQYNEVIWFYPSQNSMENDRYVIYNYVEDCWYDGNLSRTTWEDTATFDRPYATAPDGTLFVHESGKDDNGSPMLSFIETGEIDISVGNNIAFVDRFIPDFTMPDNKPLVVTILYRKYPNQPWQQKSYTITNNSSLINARVRGRRLKIIYTSDALGGDFELGSPEIGVIADGTR